MNQTAEPLVSKISLTAWRKSLLAMVGKELAPATAGAQDPRQWSAHGAVPFPTGEEVAYYENGLNFALQIGDQTISFSLWVQMGEVRIGVKVPLALVFSEAQRAKLSAAYNGQPCARVRQLGCSVQFDWIWVDSDFAGFQRMVDALSSEVLTVVLVDRIAANMRNIYLAVVEQLTEGGPATVQVLTAEPHQYSCWVLGNVSLALNKIRALGGTGRILGTKGKCTELAISLLEGDPYQAMGDIICVGNDTCQILTPKQALSFGLISSAL